MELLITHELDINESLFFVLFVGVSTFLSPPTQPKQEVLKNIP